MNHTPCTPYWTCITALPLQYLEVHRRERHRLKILHLHSSIGRFCVEEYRKLEVKDGVRMSVNEIDLQKQSIFLFSVRN